MIILLHYVCYHLNTKNSFKNKINDYNILYLLMIIGSSLHITNYIIFKQFLAIR